jgi:hypothetical protein
VSAELSASGTSRCALSARSREGARLDEALQLGELLGVGLGQASFVSGPRSKVLRRSWNRGSSGFSRSLSVIARRALDEALDRRSYAGSGAFDGRHATGVVGSWRLARRLQRADVVLKAPR